MDILLWPFLAFTASSICAIMFASNNQTLLACVWSLVSSIDLAILLKKVLQLVTQ